MPLQILHSNRVENLHEHLARQIREPHPDSTVLEGETILLDNLVLGSWINLQLALKNSIAANIRYMQSSDLFWELSRTLVSGDIPHQTPLSKSEMTWRLMALLESPGILNNPSLEPVRHYLAADVADKFTDLKRYQLSASVADLYDQYLVYRPGWINDYWDEDKSLPGKDKPASWQLAEAWQRVLWKALSKREDTTAGLQHRAAIQRQLLAKLAGELDTDSLKFRRLFVFGVTSMPDSQLETLMLLAQHIDVYLYLFNPCELEWFGIRTPGQIIRLEQQQDYQEIGNPLLAGQAGQVKDFIRLVYDKFDPYLEHSEIHDEMLFQAPAEGSLLTSIQREILDLNFRGEVAQLAVDSGQPRPLPEEERNPGHVPSVHIHNCHSPLREVEVLHDQLLDIFSRDKSLMPRDVVVMMPRVAPYVPYIDAVFRSGEPDQRIDYHISDRTLQEESPLLNSLETLLKLPDSRMPLSEVLGLLELPAVHRRFGLDREGFEQLKAWLVGAGVRWGLDAHHRRELGLPAYSDFSWAFGLNRLLAGYAMQTRVGIDNEGGITGLLEMESADAPAFNILPLDEVEGGSADLLDGFLRFWRSLTNYRRLLGQKRKPLAWKETLDSLLDAFYQPEEDEWRALNAMRRGIEELEPASTMKWYEGELSLEAVRSILQPVLQQPSRGRHPWSEGVKFCSLLPMRSVPFRIIYLLGMNMDDYPRRADQQSFDLMRNDYRPGDRSARMDDRWLFLEALLSARQIFHVSYVGQDMHRNEKREPSVVLSELIDYIRHGYQTDGAFQGAELMNNSFLYTKHPLQPFNPAYFPLDAVVQPGRCFSFNRQAYAVAKGQAEARKKTDSAARGAPRWVKSPVPEECKVVEVGLEEFVRFFTRPWDWFFRKHGVWFSRPDEELSDEEMFELPQGLGPWTARNQLLEQINRADFLMHENTDLEAGKEMEISRLIAKSKAAGEWPIGPEAKDAEDKLRKLSTDYLFALAGRRRQTEIIDVLLDTQRKRQADKQAVQLRIQGSLDRFDSEFLIQSASKPKPDKALDFYIRLALACADSNYQIERAEAIFISDYGNGAAKGFKLNQLKLPLALDGAALSHTAGYQGLLETLAGLYLDYRECGLPFLPELSLDLPVDAEDLSEAVEKQWFGTGYDQNRAIRDDMKQKAYFGAPSALHGDLFKDTAGRIRDSIIEWLMSTENQIDNHDSE